MVVMKRTDVATGLAEITAYIRSNLAGPLDLAEMAARAGFSRYHFHRVFRAVAGEPLAAYVRRERLQRAARALRDGDDDVTELALRVGYDSPSSFTRAFTDHYGVPPTEFRSDGSLPVVPPHALPRFRSRTMEFGIETLEPLRLLGLRVTGTYRYSVPAAFERLVSIARTNGLIGARTQFLGLSYDNPEMIEASELRFDACITSDADPVDELRRIDFSGGRFAVYRHTGPYELLEHVFDRLFDAVIFSGECELRDAPCLEIYRNDPETTQQKELLTDVCIPIV